MSNPFSNGSYYETSFGKFKDDVKGIWEIIIEFSIKPYEKKKLSLSMKIHFEFIVDMFNYLSFGFIVPSKTQIGERKNDFSRILNQQAAILTLINSNRT